MDAVVALLRTEPGRHKRHTLENFHGKVHFIGTFFFFSVSQQLNKTPCKSLLLVRKHPLNLFWMGIYILIAFNVVFLDALNETTMYSDVYNLKASIDKRKKMLLLRELLH